MFEIGPSLREARTRRGFSSEDVQKAIRIRDRYLHALEEEKWELLPGDAYVKGFLRTYAEYLGLNGNLYVDEYNSRFAHRDDQSLVPEAMAPVETARIGFLRPLAAIAAIVAVVAAVAAWQLRGSPTTPAAAGSSAPSSPSSHSSPPAQSSTPPAKHHSATGTEHPATTTVTTAAASRAVLMATRGRVWMEVRAGSATGAILFEGILEQGKTLPVKLSPTVWMRVGAPWNLDVRIAGKIAPGMPHEASNVLITASGIAPAA
jgi:cytoskeletal protein RodZ